jgi:selenocysteine lyase/cysteine desulfurase
MAVGPERVYMRIHELARRVRDLVQRHPRLRQANASADAFFGGLVSFEAVQGDLKAVVTECASRRIRIAGGNDRIRIATHIFTQLRELDVFAEALAKGLM